MWQSWELYPGFSRIKLDPPPLLPGTREIFVYKSQLLLINSLVGKKVGL